MRRRTYFIVLIRDKNIKSIYEIKAHTSKPTYSEDSHCFSMKLALILEKIFFDQKTFVRNIFSYKTI
jgi:hypothetical protein